MRLTLIEHGQTDFDRRGLVHGRLDPPLNARGREQAHRLGLRIARMEKPPTVLYTSPRKRAAETARIVSRAAGIPVKVAPELLPLNAGQFSGQPEKQVAEKLRPYFAAPWRQIPGGDRVASWRAANNGFARRLAASAKRGERPAAVTHSNTIGSILAMARGGEDGRNAMANPPPSASITTVQVRPGGRR